MRISHLLMFFLLFSCTIAASADPITYTETFVGSGTLGSTAFTNKAITLTFTGDTSNVTVVNEGPYDVSLMEGTGDTTISVASLGTYSVTDAIEVYDYGAGDPVPFIDFGKDNYASGKATFTSDLYSNSFACDIYVSPTCYTLQTPLGPISADTSGSESTSSASGYLDTSGGKLTISKTAKGTAFTFTVSNPPPAITPEPSSLLLLGTGIAGMFGASFRKLKRSKESQI
jgi:hypothetical protein